MVQGVKETDAGLVPKVRPIDDFSEFGINSALGVEEKVSMLGIDQVVAWNRMRHEAVKTGKFKLVDAAGAQWEAELNKDWTCDSWCKVLGRVADLKSAYKQLPRSPKHSSVSVIAVKNPVAREVQLFETVSMMLGQTAAVYGFLRFSRALATLAAWLFHLVVVEFFDDFSSAKHRVWQSHLI